MRKDCKEKEMWSCCSSCGLVAGGNVSLGMGFELSLSLCLSLSLSLSPCGSEHTPSYTPVPLRCHTPHHDDSGLTL